MGYCILKLFINSLRYRKVPGDKCEGGFMPNRSEKMTNMNCEQMLSVKDPVSKLLDLSSF